MTMPEAKLEALSEVMLRQSKVARAEALLLKAQRELRESLDRLTEITDGLPADAPLPPTVAAALQLREELPEPTPAEEKRTGTLRDRIVVLMERSPNEIHTPALIASLLGTANRDSIRNTLLALAARGRVKKIGEGRYQARPKEGAPPDGMAP